MEQENIKSSFWHYLILFFVFVLLFLVFAYAGINRGIFNHIYYYNYTNLTSILHLDIIGKMLRGDFTIIDKFIRVILAYFSLAISFIFLYKFTKKQFQIEKLYKKWWFWCIVVGLTIILRIGSRFIYDLFFRGL